MIVHPWVESRGQLFVVRFPPKPTCDEIEGFGAATHDFYENNQRHFAWVVDATGVAIQGALQRKTLAEVLERDRMFLKQYCQGMAIVVPNALLRGAGQAILWLAPDGAVVTADSQSAGRGRLGRSSVVTRPFLRSRSLVSCRVDHLR